MKLRIGIDVGGTFTDVTAFDEDAAALVAVRKYTSNPAQPAAVMEEITRDLAADCFSQFERINPSVSRRRKAG